MGWQSQNLIKVLWASLTRDPSKVESFYASRYHPKVKMSAMIEPCRGNLWQLPLANRDPRSFSKANLTKSVPVSQEICKFCQNFEPGKERPKLSFCPAQARTPSYQPPLPLFASRDVGRLKQNPQRPCRWMALRHIRPTFKPISCFIFQNLLLFIRAENNCNFAINVVAPPAPPDLSKSQKNDMLLLQWVPLDTFPTQPYSASW